MKKFLFILLIAITTSRIVTPDNAVTDTDKKETVVKKKTFNQFLSELPKDVKKAYTWLKNNQLFDDVKKILLEKKKGYIKEAQKSCTTYVTNQTKCNEFITKYNKFLKEN